MYPTPTFAHLGCAALVLVLFASDARASFTAHLNNANPASALAIALDTSNAEPGGLILAGQYNWTRTDGEYGSFMNGNDFWTFCIEITQVIHSGIPYQYSIMSLSAAPNPGLGQGSGLTGMGDLRANMIQELFEKNDFRNLYVGTDAAERNRRAAAFQVAIWEIVFEGQNGTPGPVAVPLDASSGNFKLQVGDSAVAVQANAYLSKVTSRGNYTGPINYQLQALTSGGQQDQLVVTTVPGPSGLMLALTGFPALYWLRRIRR